MSNNSAWKEADDAVLIKWYPLEGPIGVRLRLGRRFTREQVMSRRAYLNRRGETIGLSPTTRSTRGPGARKPCSDKRATTPRKCLRCRETFPSEGANEQVCATCKQSPEWRSGHDFGGQGVSCGGRSGGATHPLRTVR